MFKRLASLFLTSSLILVSGAEVVVAQSSADPFEDHNLNRYPQNPEQNLFLKVAYDKRKLTDAQVKIYDQVKDQLNKARIGVPNDRVDHFRTVIKPSSNPVCGWDGMIESIKMTKGGVVVELRINANQGREVNSTDSMERYSIISQKVHYLGTYVPPQLPGFRIGF